MARKADDTKTRPVILKLYYVNLSKIVCHIYILVYLNGKNAAEREDDIEYGN